MGHAIETYVTQTDKWIPHRVVDIPWGVL